MSYNQAADEEKKAARRERKNAREAGYREKNRQDPTKVENAKAYQAAWYAKKRQDPDWVAKKDAELAKKRQDPEWVEKKKAREKARYKEEKAKGINNYERNVKNNPEKKARRNAQIKEWRKNNPERSREIYQNSDERKKQKDPIKFLLRQRKSTAKSKGIEFDIESTDFVMPETCPVLGILITPFAGRGAPGTPSFDRTDPRKGYIKGNVKIMSYRANRLKCDCIDPAELRTVADYIEQNLEMKLEYDHEVHIDKGRQQGDTHTPWMVYCFARAEGVKPIRVQAHRAVVQDQWGIQNLHDEDAVKAAFRDHQDEHLEKASQEPYNTGVEFRVYTIK